MNVGMKCRVSLRKLLLELGMTNQPFQISFEKHGELVTWSWMTSLWEKCDRYGVKVVFSDIELELPRERDKWLMLELVWLGYNRYGVHVQEDSDI